MLLILLKFIMNLLRLRLLNKSRYMRCLCAEEYLRFATTLSTYLCWIEGAWGEAIVVAVSFCSLFEHIVKNVNFAV